MDGQLRTVEIPSGETIGYRTREGGEIPVLLLHGNMTSSRHWDLVFEEMDQAYDLYAMDMRGFGASSYDEPIDSLADFAADVAAFVDEVGLDSFHLVGWSTGGGVAMEYAAAHPDRVRKMVLVSPASTRGYPIYRKNESGQPTDEPLTTREEIAADPVQVAPVQHAYETEDREALRTIWNSLIYTQNQPEPERYEAYLDDMLTQRNLVDVDYALAHFNVSTEANEYGEGSGHVESIEAPTLVVRGERDLVISAEMAKETVDDLGDVAEFVELPDAGHSPFVDDLDAVLTEIERFLGETSSSEETDA